MHSRLMKFDDSIIANEHSCSRMLALLPERCSTKNRSGKKGGFTFAMV